MRLRTIELQFGAATWPTSLIGGMLQQKHPKPGSDHGQRNRTAEQAELLGKQFGIRTRQDNDQLASNCDVLVLCVKGRRSCRGRSAAP